jgi:sugar transferase EpsL
LAYLRGRGKYAVVKSKLGGDYFDVYRTLKRGIDVAASSVGLILLSPLIGATALLLRVTQGSVLFRQVRPGIRGEPFTVLKFCTMNNKRDANGKLLPDAERLTKLGRTLRSLSLDELPQLWNVLRGDMSLVGPRPLLMQYLPRYTPEQARRHDVRPGITGWAQVNGRNAIRWEEKFALDVWYVDHVSFAVDCRILWLTLLRVVRPQGISREGHATMPEFFGSQPTE